LCPGFVFSAQALKLGLIFLLDPNTKGWIYSALLGVIEVGCLEEWEGRREPSQVKMPDLILPAQTHFQVDLALTHRSQWSCGNLQVSVRRPPLGTGSSERQSHLVRITTEMGLKRPVQSFSVILE
jgi:hypothetical protein